MALNLHRGRLGLAWLNLANGDLRLAEALERLRAFDLARYESQRFDQCVDCSACQDLAALLTELDRAAEAYSDWLGMRFFTHVSDVSRQTMAL